MSKTSASRPRSDFPAGRSDPASLPVQRVDRDAGLPVPSAARGGHVLDLSADAVFRAEEGGEPDAPRLVEQVRGVEQAPVHRRGVADQSYRKPPQGGEALLDEHVEAGPDPLRAAPGDQDRVSHNRGRYHIFFRPLGKGRKPAPTAIGGILPKQEIFLKIKI